MQYSMQNLCTQNTNSPAEWFKLIPAPPGKMDFSFGIPIIFLLLITLITYKKVDKKYKRIYNISIALSILSLIMCTKLFPWKSMPHFLTIIQFALMTQGFFILFISIGCGINAHVLTESLSKIKTRNIVFVVMIIFISALFQISNKFIKQPYERERIEDTVAKYDRIGVYNIKIENGNLEVTIAKKYGNLITSPQLVDFVLVIDKMEIAETKVTYKRIEK